MTCWRLTEIWRQEQRRWNLAFLFYLCNLKQKTPLKKSMERGVADLTLICRCGSLEVQAELRSRPLEVQNKIVI
jgi:hypothetical protein